MALVTATRIVRPAVVVRIGGEATIESRVETFAVTFTDDDGNQVSLAFDGRFQSEHCGGSMVMETYREYSDCPVLINGTEVRDKNTLRALRDALNVLDLT
jgi:hypothetical protein